MNFEERTAQPETEDEEAIVSPNETNNLMGIIEEEDSSIDFNSSLRSKPLSDGGEKRRSEEVHTGYHKNMPSSEPVNIVQTVEVQADKVFETTRGGEVNIEIASI